jgi:hypothetical protein
MKNKQTKRRNAMMKLLSGIEINNSVIRKNQKLKGEKRKE